MVSRQTAKSSSVSHFSKESPMKRESLYTMQVILLTAFAFLFYTPRAHAQGQAQATYKAKCAACHAADGSGSEVGKKLGVHDFHSSQVQSESDADLTQLIVKGKNKMPAYEKSLKPDEIKGLTAYVRDLAKK
jgi:cytochrome c6